MNSNVMVLPAGFDLELIRMLRAVGEGIADRPGLGQVIPADASRDWATMVENWQPQPGAWANGVHVPRFETAGSAAQILDICHEWQVGGILPAAEVAYDWFLDHRAFLEDGGVSVIWPDDETVQNCRDKLKLAELLKQVGARSSLTVDGFSLWSDEDARQMFPYPVIVKNRDSTGSRFVYPVLKNPVELQNYLNYILSRNGQEVVVQRYHQGPEISMHLMFDWEGRVVAYNAHRLMSHSRQGFAWATQSVRPDWLATLVEQVSQIGNFAGPVNVDVIEVEGEPVVLDVNTRVSDNTVVAMYMDPPGFAEAIFYLARGEQPLLYQGCAAGITTYAWVARRVQAQ